MIQTASPGYKDIYGVIETCLTFSRMLEFDALLQSGFVPPKEISRQWFIHLGWRAKPHKIHSQVHPRYTNSLTDSKKLTTPQFYYWCRITIIRTLSSLFPFTIISRFIALLLLFSHPPSNNRKLKTGPALSRCVHIVKRPGTSTTEHQRRPKMMHVSLKNLLDIPHRTAGISQLVYCGLDDRGIWVCFPAGAKRFCVLPKALKSTQGPTQPHVQCVPPDFPMQVERPGH